jgi:hypothetical protein
MYIQLPYNHDHDYPFNGKHHKPDLNLYKNFFSRKTKITEIIIIIIIKKKSDPADLSNKDGGEMNGKYRFVM